MNPKELRIDTVNMGKPLGWSFIPLKGKIPQLKEWQKKKSESYDDACDYAEQGNIGIRTGKNSGGLVVIDVDNGGDIKLCSNLPDQFIDTDRGLRIESGVRFITKKVLWLVYNGSCDRYPFLHTTTNF